MKAEEVREYLNKLKKFNEWELEQKKNYDPQVCVERVAALYEFGIKVFSQESIERNHQEHLESLIFVQSQFMKIKEMLSHKNRNNRI
ncbi:MAG: hypothetical protein JXN63_00755 [Candidatus Delongbacteria bacterium]|nr:hypothetical protein [Candidatus Delongbacteria bacterium]